MADREVRCAIIRGGTSKGVYIERDQLPPPGPKRDGVILRLFGSPDRRQIDGLGGADQLTSKTAIMGPPTRPDCDIDYLFGQVDITSPMIDWSGNCGNLSSGAALYAVYKGYVQAVNPMVEVRVHQVNTGRRFVATVPVVDGRPAVHGDFVLDGVPGTGSRMNLDFQDFAGCTLNRGLLPTGAKVDRLEVPGLGILEASIVDLANLAVFVRAAEVGLDHELGVDALQRNGELVAMLESIRGEVALRVGLATRANVEKEMRLRTNPFLIVVGKPRSYLAANGKTVDDQATDLFSRSICQGLFHKGYPATGAVATGVACVLPGTIAAEMVRGGPPAAGEIRTVRIGHPGGILEVEAGISAGGQGVVRATLGRTARVLMEGIAFTRE